MNQRILATAVACLGLWLAACSDNTGTKDGQDLKCGEGQAIKYHADTGKPYCVDAADAGSLGDGAIGTDQDGGTSGGTDGTGGGTDGGTKDSGSKDTGGPGSDATDDTGSGTGCPPAATETGAGQSGQACTQDSDCLYGHCMFGLPLAGYDAAIGMCARQCGCPTSCSSDNSEGVGYGCAFEATVAVGNPKRSGDNPPIKVCARECKSDADCKAWNPALPDCIKSSTKYVSVSPNGACGKNPLK